MRVKYILHSCFFVESDSCCMLFDYYKGDLPEFPAGKPLFVFASHRHGDHFSPDIFRLPADHFILGRDFSLSPGIRAKYGLSDDQYARCHRMRTDETLEISGMRIRALRSTDEGAAFHIAVDGKNIYHAGDLNQWVWREDDHYDRQMTADYLAEIEKLRGVTFDAAFLPVDPRQGDDFYLGADNFIRMHRPKIVYPMHLWEDYAAVARFKAHPCAADYAHIVEEIHAPGEEFSTGHRIFVQNPAPDCPPRPGAYILPVRDGKIAVVRTPKGLFMLGGGIEPGESHPQAVERECMEETGCRAALGEFVCSAEAFTTHRGSEPYHPVQYYYLGEISEPVCPPVEPDHQLLWMDFEQIRGKMFSPMQNWALEMCLRRST